MSSRSTNFSSAFALGALKLVPISLLDKSVAPHSQVQLGHAADPSFNNSVAVSKSSFTVVISSLTFDAAF